MLVTYDPTRCEELFQEKMQNSENNEDENVVKIIPMRAE